MGLKEKISSLLEAPKALTSAADTIRLFRRVDDMEAFQEALEEGEYERARKMTGLSEEEFHNRVSDIRRNSDELAREFSDVATADEEEVRKAIKEAES